MIHLLREEAIDWFRVAEYCVVKPGAPHTDDSAQEEDEEGELLADVDRLTQVVDAQHQEEYRTCRRT